MILATHICLNEKSKWLASRDEPTWISATHTVDLIAGVGRKLVQPFKQVNIFVERPTHFMKG
jgi:hypothetical protein